MPKILPIGQGASGGVVGKLVFSVALGVFNPLDGLGGWSGFVICSKFNEQLCDGSLKKIAK